MDTRAAISPKSPGEILMKNSKKWTVNRVDAHVVFEVLPLPYV